MSYIIAHSLFRTHLNFYDGVFLQKDLAAKNHYNYIFAKMLHHRILIGFPNASLGNIVQMTSKRRLKDISSII